MSARSSGRFAVVPIVILYDERIGDAAKVVYALLSTYCSSDGFARPTLMVLAKRLGISRRVVSRHIRALTKFGYIRTKPSMRADGSQGPNTYFLPFHDLGPRRETNQSDPPSWGLET